MTTTNGVQRKDQEKVLRPPKPVEKSRKERRREPLKAASMLESLKAERVQEELKSMPSWKLADGKRAIDRVLVFPDGQQAGAYMALVAGLAGMRGQSVDISYANGRVVITVCSLLPQGRRGLTRDALDFARLLG